jgi:hypothetical protein
MGTGSLTGVKSKIRVEAAKCPEGKEVTQSTMRQQRPQKQQEIPKRE